MFYLQMSTSDLRDVATGLHYVATQSKNRDLAKSAVKKLVELRQSLSERQRPSTSDLVGLIDNYINEGNKKVGFHAYDAAEVFEDPSDISKTCLSVAAYILFLIAIASYVSLVNKSLGRVN